MAEPLLVESIPIPTIPGEWLASPSAGVLHFFEDGSQRSFCNHMDRQAGRAPESLREWGRCTVCSNRLGVEHSRLDRKAEEARARQVDPAPAPHGHRARARHFERLAANTPERFRKVHFLAEARAELIRARGGYFAGQRVELP